MIIVSKISSVTFFEIIKKGSNQLKQCSVCYHLVEKRLIFHSSHKIHSFKKKKYMTIKLLIYMQTFYNTVAAYFEAKYNSLK